MRAVARCRSSSTPRRTRTSRPSSSPCTSLGILRRSPWHRPAPRYRARTMLRSRRRRRARLPRRSARGSALALVARSTRGTSASRSSEFPGQRHRLRSAARLPRAPPRVRAPRASSRPRSRISKGTCERSSWCSRRPTRSSATPRGASVAGARSTPSSEARDASVVRGALGDPPPRRESRRRTSREQQVLRHRGRRSPVDSLRSWLTHWLSKTHWSPSILCMRKLFDVSPAVDVGHRRQVDGGDADEVPVAWTIRGGSVVTWVGTRGRRAP